MLRSLTVANFAVAEKVELSFGPGFTALTGETGAGKSILLEALGFLLGARGSASWLRAGAERLSVEGVFDAADVPASLRAAHGLPASGTVAVRRELDASGRTRAQLAGKPAPISALAELGDAFADFHAQHEHQALLRGAFQLDLLDRYAGLETLRSELETAHGRWTALKSRLAASEMSEQERESRAGLLRWQLEEIDALKPKLGEEEVLEERLPRLRGAEKLRALAETAHSLLWADEDSALARLGKAEKALGDMARLDPALEGLRAELESARVSLDASARELGSYKDGVAADPAALDSALTRLDALAKLKKKHGPSVADVLAARERLAEELDGLENADARLEKTRKELADAERALSKLCDDAHAERVKAAKKLEAASVKELKALGLPHARFSCSVLLEEGAWTRAGADTVEFLLAPNPGEPARPLKSAASGGELSRVMLALKTAFAKADRTPLLVFDEVDSGVGGEVARAVGERLAALAKGRQVLCVTHLPQVACFAAQHLHAAKALSKGRTLLSVERLDGERRLETVAAMLGGRGATAASRRHAQELLETSS